MYYSVSRRVPQIHTQSYLTLACEDGGHSAGKNFFIDKNTTVNGREIPRMGIALYRLIDLLLETPILSLNQ
jgi:hypothetical protein